MIRYTVRVQFTSDDQPLVARWLGWMQNDHLQKVIDGGATRAELVAIDDRLPLFEIRYHFANRSDLDLYLADHAPRLRAEGIAAFPLELGLDIRRSTGTVVFEVTSSRSAT